MTTENDNNPELLPDDDTPDVTPEMLVAFMEENMPMEVHGWLMQNLPDRLQKALNTRPTQSLKAVDGWKLVPVEPTEEMHWAGVEKCCPSSWCSCKSDDIYRAMIAAAPAQPQQTEEAKAALEGFMSIHDYLICPNEHVALGETTRIYYEIRPIIEKLLNQGGA